MWKNFTRNTMERLGDIVAPPVDSEDEEVDDDEMDEDEDINSQDEYYVEGEEEGEYEEEEEERRGAFGFVGLLTKALDTEQHEYDESHEEDEVHYPEETVDLQYYGDVAAESPSSGAQEIQDHHSMLSDHQSHAFGKKEPLMSRDSAASPTPDENSSIKADQEFMLHEAAVSKSPVPNTFLKREAGSITPASPSNRSHSHRSHSLSVSPPTPLSAQVDEPVIFSSAPPDRDTSDQSARIDLLEPGPDEKSRGPSPPQIDKDSIGSGALFDKPTEELPKQTDQQTLSTRPKEESSYYYADSVQPNGAKKYFSAENESELPVQLEIRAQTQTAEPFTAEASEHIQQTDAEAEKQEAPSMTALGGTDYEEVKYSDATLDDIPRNCPPAKLDSPLTAPPMSAEPAVLPSEELEHDRPFPKDQSEVFRMGTEEALTTGADYEEVKYSDATPEVKPLNPPAKLDSPLSAEPPVLPCEELEHDKPLSKGQSEGSRTGTEVLTAELTTEAIESQAVPLPSEEASFTVPEVAQTGIDEPVVLTANEQEATQTGQSARGPEKQPEDLAETTTQGECIEEVAHTGVSLAEDRKRIQELEQRCVNLEMQLEQAEGHVVELQQQASLQLEEEERQHQMFQEKELRLLQAAAEDHQLEMDRLQRQMDDNLEAMQSETEQVRALAARQQGELQRLLKEANARAESAFREKQKTLAQHESASTQHQKQQERALRMAEDKLAQTMAVLDDREEQIKQLKAKIQHLESEMSEHGHGLHEAEEEIDELHHENESLRKQVERTEAHFSELRAKIVELQHDSEMLSHAKVNFLLLKVLVVATMTNYLHCSPYLADGTANDERGTRSRTS